MSEWTLSWIGGNCPVQAEGMFADGSHFYFRARGASWTIEVSHEEMTSDSIGETNVFWSVERPFGVWPEAGLMKEEIALQFIEVASQLYALEKKTRPDLVSRR